MGEVFADVGSVCWLCEKAEIWCGCGLWEAWWRWVCRLAAWKGVLKRSSATLTAGDASASPRAAALPPGPGIMCLHLRLRPLTLLAKVQVPFHGEEKK